MHAFSFIISTLALASGALAQDDTVILSPVTTLKPVPTADKCVVTYREPFPCGDCGIGTKSVTATTDCGSCARLTTRTSVGVGICVCPTKPATRTYNVCKPTKA